MEKSTLYQKRLGLQGGWTDTKNIAPCKIGCILFWPSYMNISIRKFIRNCREIIEI